MIFSPYILNHINMLKLFIDMLDILPWLTWSQIMGSYLSKYSLHKFSPLMFWRLTQRSEFLAFLPQLLGFPILPQAWNAVQFTCTSAVHFLLVILLYLLSLFCLSQGQYKFEYGSNSILVFCISSVWDYSALPSSLNNTYFELKQFVVIVTWILYMLVTWC